MRAWHGVHQWAVLPSARGGLADPEVSPPSELQQAFRHGAETGGWLAHEQRESKYFLRRMRPCVAVRSAMQTR